MPNVGSTSLNSRVSICRQVRVLLKGALTCIYIPHSVLPLDVKEVEGFLRSNLLTFAIWRIIMFIVWLLGAYHRLESQVVALIK